MLPARPLADHQQVPRVIGVDQQLVAQVALEARNQQKGRNGQNGDFYNGQ